MTCASATLPGRRDSTSSLPAHLMVPSVTATHEFAQAFYALRGQSGNGGVALGRGRWVGPTCLSCVLRMRSPPIRHLWHGPRLRESTSGFATGLHWRLMAEVAPYRNSVEFGFNV